MNVNSFNASENGSLICPMDGLQYTEEVVKTSSRSKKTKRSKSPHSRFWICLYRYLSQRRFEHMLKFVEGSDETEFEVIFIDKKSRKWVKRDIELFVALDNYIGKTFKRKRSSEKYDEAVKIRFKSNMSKCVKSGYTKEIPTDKEKEKCITIKRYRILWKPSVAEQKNLGKINDKDYESQNKAGKKNIRIQDDSKNGIISIKNSPLMNNSFSEFILQSAPVDSGSMNFENAFLGDNSTSEEKNVSNTHYLCLSTNFQASYKNISIHEDSKNDIIDIKSFPLVSCPISEFIPLQSVPLDGGSMDFDEFQGENNTFEDKNVVNMNQNGDKDFQRISQILEYLKIENSKDSMEKCINVGMDQNGEKDFEVIVEDLKMSNSIDGKYIMDNVGMDQNEEKDFEVIWDDLKISNYIDGKYIIDNMNCDSVPSIDLNNCIKMSPSMTPKSEMLNNIGYANSDEEMLIKGYYEISNGISINTLQENSNYFENTDSSLGDSDQWNESYQTLGEMEILQAILKT